MRILWLFRFLWCSFTLLRPFGVPVELHITWLVFPFGFALWRGWECRELTGVLITLPFMGLLYATVLVHEFAHILVARHYGCATRRVLVVPFGMFAELESIPFGAPELFIAAAGPLASFLVSWLAYDMALALHGHHGYVLWWLRRGLRDISMLNFGFACFNLIPCFPMDGGRIFRSGLTIALAVLFRRSCRNPVLLATRLTVRYVGRLIILGAFVIAILYSHDWTRLLIFAFLGLAAEAEWLLLNEATPMLGRPRELRFLPVTQEWTFRQGGFRSKLGSHYNKPGLAVRINPQSLGSSCLPFLTSASSRIRDDSHGPQTSPG